MSQAGIKRIFCIAGELSGDKLGGWYLARHLKKGTYVQAVGGDNIKAAGANLYMRFEELNVVGIVEIVKHLPRLMRYIKQLTQHIIDQKFTEVVLIDFPGFNMIIAKRLKRIDPSITITYLSPPQVWCWGQWRVKKLKRFCDRLIVLYPFEVAWYKERGVEAQWLGCPTYDRLKPIIGAQKITPLKKIALLPGSRRSEIETLFPLFAYVIKKFCNIYKDVSFVLPRAQSIPLSLVEKKIKETGLSLLRSRIKIVPDGPEGLQELSTCCLALTKPGTITLELALLGIPAVMFYKVSWLTYLLAKPLVKVNHMALPNLLLNDEVYKELIQGECKNELIFDHAHRLYKNFLQENKEYNRTVAQCEKLQSMLAS